MQYFIAAARSIGSYMTDQKLVVDKGNVPVSTADVVRAVIADKLKKRGVDTHFGVASSPVFLNESAPLAKPAGLFITTKRKDFRSLYFDHIKSPLKRPVIFGGHSHCTPKLVRIMAFDYLTIGC